MSEQTVDQSPSAWQHLRSFLPFLAKPETGLPPSLSQTEILEQVFRKIHEYDSSFQIPQATPLKDYQPSKEDPPEGDIRLYHGLTKAGLHGLINIIVEGFKASATNPAVRKHDSYAFLSTGLSGSARYSLDQNKNSIGVVLELELKKAGLLPSILGSEGAIFYGLNISSPNITFITPHSYTEESPRVRLNPTVLKGLYIVNPPQEGKKVADNSTIYKVTGDKDAFLQVATALAQRGLVQDDSLRYAPVK